MEPRLQLLAGAEGRHHRHSHNSGQEAAHLTKMWAKSHCPAKVFFLVKVVHLLIISMILIHRARTRLPHHVIPRNFSRSWRRFYQGAETPCPHPSPPGKRIWSRLRERPAASYDAVTADTDQGRISREKGKEKESTTSSW